MSRYGYRHCIGRIGQTLKPMEDECIRDGIPECFIMNFQRVLRFMRQHMQWFHLP